MVALLQFLEKSGCEAGLTQLMGEVIPSAIIRIQNAIRLQKGELAGSENVYGEKQLALDVQANGIIIEELRKSELVEHLASEELEGEETIGARRQALGIRRFGVVFDPLDGSSLVDVNFAVGSIFGIYPEPFASAQGKIREGSPSGFIGQTGDDQIAACFAVYGPRTTLVLTVRRGTHEFVLADDGNFYLSKENLTVAAEAKHFASGNLRAASERRDYMELVNNWMRRELTLRYSGGFVPDINHILLKGDGIFTYPPYSKYPQGKLRLLFECAPMALLMEQAGGVASDGRQRILDKKITDLHERTPIYIGSTEEVENAKRLLS